MISISRKTSLNIFFFFFFSCCRDQQSIYILKKKKIRNGDLLRSIDGEEGDPPPMLPILSLHISKPPILSGTPLPLFPPKIVVSQPHTPQPRQHYHRPRPPRVELRQWVALVEMGQHHRNHRPVQVNHLLGNIKKKS